MQGERLRQLREMRGITQEELAAQMGIGTNQIWRWESGKNDPTSDMVVMLSRLLNVSTDFLLGLTDDPAQNLSYDDLTPMEKKFISAVRRGLIVEALETFATMSQRSDESGIAPGEPAVQS